MKFELAILASVALLCGLGFMSVAQTAPTATVSGKWHFVLETDGGDRIVEPTFQQDGEKVTGKWDTADVKGTFSDGKLNLEFPYNSDEAGAGTLKITAQFAEDVLTGDWAFQDYSGKFKATRAK